VASRSAASHCKASRVLARLRNARVFFMANKKTKTRQNRRDRRKAKESGFARSGTVNPKKVGHHATDPKAAASAFAIRRNYGRISDWSNWIETMSGELKPWPKDWPPYRQACYGSPDDNCDMLIGPCACGAWHKVGEFELREGVVYRRGAPMPEAI
jgi:hypothetical protein